MTGLFGTLGTATRGMNANQNALQTSGHNISNMNTDGYSRQRVRMQTEQPYLMAGVGALGTGVRTAGVDRITDSFIRTQTQTAYSKFRFFEQKSHALGQLEQYMNEPSKTGMINQLSVMHDSWAKLGSNPELGTSKTLVVENSNSFTDMVNQTGNQIGELQGEMIDNIEKSALDFNEKVKELQILNGQIYDLASQNTTPNDLLDRRDSLLKDLSGMADISSETDMYGRVSSLKIGNKATGTEILSLDGRKEISAVTGETGSSNTISLGGNAQNKVTIDGDLPLGTIVLADTSTTPATVSEVEVKEGQIGGFQEATKEVKDRLEEFQAFVKSVADTINRAYKAKSGEDFFTFDVNGKMQVNQSLRDNPSTLVVGKGDNPEAGDGSLATEIGSLFSKKDADGLTFSERYNSIVTKNGISKQQADNTANSQLTVLNQLEYKNESISGVNINEEVSDVMRFSQAFQANARIIQTVSEMLDTLINRTGV
ncbi:MAG TPA: flagellar hook-associated protein FlgK [Candidatus Enterococcus avicola]|uniref:Flagellar hook-associated protein 1 n=1 Tax=Candidatus Enterococcus avicola TaxID=2838561 RepID=A0A9D2F7W7_9ENTE|nr:flagellar hook-associated protein FlgK [Candidatus Enterococcus avicola]